MAKSYSKASVDVERTIERMRDAHHPELEKVSVDALFVYDLESTLPVLQASGYPAYATVKITPLKDRVMGIADAVITVDRSSWLTLPMAVRDALIDHELTHLVPKCDEDSGVQLFDSHDRPCLEIRKHDHQLGWFDDVARRHGQDSIEIRQARQLIESTQQLYFDFTGQGAPPPVSDILREAARQMDGRQVEMSDGSTATMSVHVHGDPEPDTMYEAAAAWLTEGGTETITISQLQRKMEIGYNRAARILEALEAKGYVGPFNTGGARRVLVLGAGVAA